MSTVRGLTIFYPFVQKFTNFGLASGRFRFTVAVTCKPDDSEAKLNVQLRRREHACGDSSNAKEDLCSARTVRRATVSILFLCTNLSGCRLAVEGLPVPEGICV